MLSKNIFIHKLVSVETGKKRPTAYPMTIQSTVEIIQSNRNLDVLFPNIYNYTHSSGDIVLHKVGAFYTLFQPKSIQ